MPGHLVISPSVKAAAAGFALTLAAYGGWSARGAIADRALALLRAEHAEQIAASNAAAAAAGRRERQREADWNRDYREIADDAQEQIDRARADAARAARAADGLRAAAQAAARACRGAGEGAAAAEGGASAADAGLVFADVLGGMDARGRELAALADERGAAGAACERAHESLTTR